MEGSGKHWFHKLLIERNTIRGKGSSESTPTPLTGEATKPSLRKGYEAFYDRGITFEKLTF